MKTRRLFVDVAFIKGKRRSYDVVVVLERISEEGDNGQSQTAEADGPIDPDHRPGPTSLCPTVPASTDLNYALPEDDPDGLDYDARDDLYRMFRKCKSRCVHLLIVRAHVYSFDSFRCGCRM